MNKQAFDAIAAGYDQEFTNTIVGRLQRERVYHYLQQLFLRSSVSNAVEINCGTGEDAIWLAQQGKNVIATDISPKMVEVAKQKAQNHAPEISSLIRHEVCSITALESLKTSRPVDLLFSNFGGINCLSPEQLHQFASDSSHLIRAGGLAVAVIMGRFCWWETLYFSLKRNKAKAWRRRQKGATLAPLDKDTHVPTWYYSPADISAHFEEDFKLIQIVPIGFWLPPSYLDPFFRTKPGLLQLLDRLEKWHGHFSLLAKGADHYLIVFEKK